MERLPESINTTQLHAGSSGAVQPYDTPDSEKTQLERTYWVWAKSEDILLETPVVRDEVWISPFKPNSQKPRFLPRKYGDARDGLWLSPEDPEWQQIGRAHV